MLSEQRLHIDQDAETHPKADVFSQCSVVDLFCGVGGITHGFWNAGFDVVAGLDIDGSCRYAYETNNPGSRFIEADVSNYDHQEISRLFGDDRPVRVLIGCAPCQPFSTNNSKRTKNDTDDKWTLVGRFVDVVESVRPNIVSMENVPNLMSFDGGRILSENVERLRAMGYRVSTEVVTCAAYRVPQSRKRLVILASQFGEIRMLPGELQPDNYRTVWQTIGHLEELEAGETSNQDALHKARGLSDVNLRRIQQSRPGGTWQDWDEALVAACHVRPTGRTYKGVYGRMEWDAPAPTITAQFYGYGSGRFGHPTQNRALSLREGALLQTFPKDYQFVSPENDITFEQVGTHIGNAVPVDLARAIARTIAAHLEGYR